MVNQKTKGQYQKCLQLEKELKSISRQKPFLDPAVRNLRVQLRDALENLLFEDYSYAQSVDCEPLLWKNVFYKPIEEFRRRIRQAIQQGEKGRELYQKAASTFRKFLADSEQFYTLLALKLQQSFGDVGLQLPLAEDQDIFIASAVGQNVDGRLSINRCLICLGDLARYEAPLATDKSKKDWSKAAGFYREAVRVFPEGGNSYNQLAVLETHEENELAAVYYYFRALSVNNPFLIARENLILLFEQNRQRYEGMEAGATRNRPFNTLLNQLATRFVRINGLLFTKIDLDKFQDVYAAAFGDFGELMSRLLLPKGPPYNKRVDTLLAQIVVMAMFSTHNIYFVPDGHNPGYSEVLQRSELRGHALSVVFNMAAQLSSTVSSAVASSAQVSLPMILAPLNAMLLWLSTHKEFLSVKEPSPAELKARKQFWQAAATLMEETGRQLETCGATHEQPSNAALPEEYALRGFAPLETALASLVFGEQQPEDNMTVRWQRVVSSGKALRSVLQDGSVVQDDISTQPFVSAVDHLISPQAMETTHEDMTGNGISSHDEGQEEVIVFVASKAAPLPPAPPIPQPTALPPTPLPASTIPTPLPEPPSPITAPVATPTPTTPTASLHPNLVPVSVAAHTDNGMPPNLSSYQQYSGLMPAASVAAAPGAARVQAPGQASAYADTARAPSPSQLPSDSLFTSSLFGRDLFAEARLAHFDDVSRPMQGHVGQAYGMPMHAGGQQGTPSNYVDPVTALRAHMSSRGGDLLWDGSHRFTPEQHSYINAHYGNGLGGAYGQYDNNGNNYSNSSLFGTLFPSDMPPAREVLAPLDMLLQREAPVPGSLADLWQAARLEREAAFVHEDSGVWPSAEGANALDVAVARAVGVSAAPPMSLPSLVVSHSAVPSSTLYTGGTAGGWGWLDAFAVQQPVEASSALPFPGMSTSATAKGTRRTLPTENPFVP